MPRIGVIGISDGWSSQSLAQAVAQATGHPPLVIEMEEVRLDLPSGRATARGLDFGELDGLIVKKIGAQYSPDLLDRLEILRLLAARGLPVFSHPERIMGMLNRLACTATLQVAGIPMPPTTLTEDVDQAEAALSEYGRAVFKPLYSTKARGMILLQSGPEVREDIQAYASQFPMMYIQKAVDIQGGRDLGLVFLGGEYLTTYARCKTNDSWNTTTASGGRYAPFDPDPEIIELAARAQAPFGLDFTCVDVVLTPDGPLVFEVSAFGGFRGVVEARGFDPAPLLVKHVLSRLEARS